MIQTEHFVDFWQYCPICKYETRRPNDEPCEECLSNPANINSRKPVKFEEDTK